MRDPFRAPRPAGSPPSPTSSPLITKTFEETWHDVAPRLEASLRARGTDPDTARDLSQEVAIRLMSSDTEFADDDHVLRWCLVVGRRLAANLYRDRARLLVGVVPDRAAGHEPDEVVSGRLAIAEVAQAMNRLSQAERTALLAEPAAPTRQERVAQAVRRHRARKRLLAMVSGVLGWIGSVPLVRRMLRPETAAVAAVPLALTLTLALLPQDHEPRRTDDRAFVRPIRSEPVEVRPDAADPMPAAVSTTSVPTTSRPGASPAEPPSPLAPLHGTQVPLPTGDDSEIAIFPRGSEPLVCIYDNPLLGDVCMLG